MATVTKMSSAEISLKEIGEGKVLHTKNVNDLFKQCGIIPAHIPTYSGKKKQTTNTLRLWQQQ